MKQWEIERANRWRHHGLQGSVGMMRANLNAIVRSVTATDESKRLANNLLEKVEELRLSLNDRADQKIPLD